MTARNPLLAAPAMASAQERVEKRLLAAVDTAEPAMTEMAGHLVRAGGKRQRPLFAVAAALVGRDDVSTDADPRLDDAVTGGVSVELVHIGSLCHDDVIDEAVTRRTVESVNARWGNLRAILAGDLLLARASELAASLGTEVAGLLAATIGRLCAGEVHELQLAYRVDRSEDHYLTSIEGKTATLFATACRIGGIVADLPRPHIDALGEFGRRYGLAFQIADDVLDLVATADELGKPAGHDMAEGIYTLPVLRTLAAGDGALASVLGAPLGPEDRDRALAIVRRGDGLAAAVDVARAHVDRAVETLAPLPPAPATRALAGAARHLVDDLADHV